MSQFPGSILTKWPRGLPAWCLRNIPAVQSAPVNHSERLSVHPCSHSAHGAAQQRSPCARQARTDRHARRACRHTSLRTRAGASAAGRQGSHEETPEAISNLATPPGPSVYLTVQVRAFSVP